MGHDETANVNRLSLLNSVRMYQQLRHILCFLDSVCCLPRLAIPVSRHRDCQQRTKEHVYIKQANMYPWQKGRDDIPSLLVGERAVENDLNGICTSPYNSPIGYLFKLRVCSLGLPKSLTKSSFKQLLNLPKNLRKHISRDNKKNRWTKSMVIY